MMEVAVGVAVAGWFVSPNISKLSEVARSCAASTYKWQTDLPGKLQKLAADLEAIREYASSMCIMIEDENKIARLWKLKDAIHDAEEIIDAFEYEVLEADMKKQCRSGARQAMDSSVDLAKHVFGTNESFNRLKKLMDDLDEVHQDLKNLSQASQNSTVRRPIQRTTTSLSSKHVLFGYDKEYADLLSKLVTEEKSSNLAAVSQGGRGGAGDCRVVAIIGHGGMGKTELARRAFDDQKEVIGQSFDVFIWACTYAMFTKTEILREILDSADRSRGSTPAGQMNDTSIEAELIKLVENKRCLLVLDDVCNDELTNSYTIRKQTWDGVLAPFKRHGSERSRIMITTRAKICALTLDAGASIVLNGIDDQAMTLLLKETAFRDQFTDLRPQLQCVVEKYVCRLRGSPLAAQIVVNDNGLRNSTAKWEEELNKDHHDNVVLRNTHLSSYQNLPPQLQRCFAFCSIFPNNHRFQPKELIKMWIAHGFVEDTAAAGKSMEDVATGYFDDLVNRSLFQKEKDKAMSSDSSSSCWYVIHEQIHSMIRHVSSSYCISVTSLHGAAAARLVIPATARHLSVSWGCLNQFAKEFSASGRLNKLRTLLVLKDDDPSSKSLHNDTLKEFKGVRVLDLTHTSIIQLPESIGKLKHLRYLHLPCTTINLCDQVTRLLFLQTLGVSKKGKLDKFPSDMSSLINMRHLDIDTGCIAKIFGIGRMDKLQGSVEFKVGCGKEGRHSMSELAGLNCLQETLSIKGLESVTGKKEAEDAQLTRKELIKVLKLEWGHPNPRDVGATDEISGVVLEGLQPNKNLRELHITRYRGTITPTWLGSGSSSVVLENLARLYLNNCRKLQALPPVGKLPRLKILGIKELPCVERIGSSGEFPSLEEITLQDMEKLVAWDEKQQSTGGCMLFPQLRKVTISDCPLLRSLLALQCCRSSLRSLCVDNCPAITKASLPTDFTTKGFPFLAGGLNILGCTLQLQELP